MQHQQCILALTTEQEMAQMEDTDVVAEEEVQCMIHQITQATIYQEEEEMVEQDSF